MSARDATPRRGSGSNRRPEDVPLKGPRGGRRKESLHPADRPGPGDRGRDAERPLAARDPEEQSGGRSMEEEIFQQPDGDDAGALPHQLQENRGPEPRDRGRVGPERGPGRR